MKILKQKKENYYFKTFCEIAQIAMDISGELKDILHNFDANNILDYVESLHKFENSADIKRHELCNKLVHEFVTPIEREDIAELSQCLDNVVDAVDDIIRKIYMFNVSEIRKEALEFSDIISSSCAIFIKLFAELENFKKSEKLKNFIIELNTMENTADKLHAQSVKYLFEEKTDPNLTLAWVVIFDSMEDCIDACEMVADMINAIITKNT